jgi:hypothetical protein
LSEPRVCTDARKKVKNILLYLQKKAAERGLCYKNVIAIPGLPFHEEQTRRLAEIFNQLARYLESAIAGFDPSAGPVVPVDPNVMVMMAPMPRDPAPVSSMRPVARAIRVIRLIAELDTDTDRIGAVDKAAHAKEYRKK